MPEQRFELFRSIHRQQWGVRYLEHGELINICFHPVLETLVQHFNFENREVILSVIPPAKCSFKKCSVCSKEAN